jgi:hypothetical protein
VLVRSDLSQAEPVFAGADQFGTTVDDVGAGVLHLAVPFDDNWSLSVDGESVPARRAFGETTAFDVTAGGVATLRYDSPALRFLAVAFQALLWIVALVVVSQIRVPTPGRRRLVDTDEAIIDLSSEPIVDPALQPVLTPPEPPTTGTEEQ